MYLTRRRPAVAGQPQPVPSAHYRSSLVAAALVALGASISASAAQAQDTFKPPPPVTYTQKYEVFGGINFMNGQAGQTLPKRYNMAGGEVMGTYWLKPNLGVAADVRYDAGTTPVLPAGQTVGVQTRPLVSQFIYMGGAQYHLLGNQFAGVNLHALAGASSGQFDHSNPNLPANVFYPATGLYTNRTAFMGTVGGSIDFNRSAKLAVRISPEVVFERFGTDLREFVYVSGGIVYRFGER